LYNCADCARCEDCEDFNTHRRFAFNGVTLVDGPASIRCAHSQFDRRKDYHVDLNGMRLRELLTRFGFIDVERDDGCLNVCRECLRYDCPMNPVRYPEQTYTEHLRRRDNDGSAYFDSLFARLHRYSIHFGDSIEVPIDRSKRRPQYGYGEHRDRTMYTNIERRSFTRRIVRAASRWLGRDGGAV
jgi:hypothetical protein